MKPKNSFRGRLLPSRSTPIFLLSLSLLLHNPQPAAAQTGLQPGDRLPARTLSHVLNRPGGTLNSNQFRNQLLIIDFFNTYCGNCIEALPKLATLQQQFAGRLAILVVSNEPEKSLRAFLAHNPERAAGPLLFASDDRQLQQLFPHVYLPHEAWIYKGTVSAISEADYVTAENISAILNGQQPGWAVKTDRPAYDYQQPLVSGTPAAYTVIKAYLPGVATRMISDTLSRQHITRFINYSLLDLYQYTYKSSTELPFSQVRITAPHPGYFIYRHNSAYRDNWNRAHTFCYEAGFPPGISDLQAKAKIRADLNFFFGLSTHITDTLTETIELARDKPAAATQPGPAAGDLSFITTGALLDRLNHDYVGLPFFSAMPRDSVINAFIPPEALNNVYSLSEALRPYGITLRPRKTLQRMLIISPAGQANYSFNPNPAL